MIVSHWAGKKPFRSCVEVPVLGEVIWSSLTWGASLYRMRLKRPALSWSGISKFEDEWHIGSETVVDDFFHLASLGSLFSFAGYSMLHSLGFHFWQPHLGSWGLWEVKSWNSDLAALQVIVKWAHAVVVGIKSWPGCLQFQNLRHSYCRSGAWYNPFKFLKLGLSDVHSNF